ncbi:DMT family transporter [Paraburkholderia atlantica]|uniref:DMT family transporter n=1 Tax=Paraburkholderia atlantica TaxID=2654982 RepID=UPI001618FC8E|nr:DMT family transporter [Paraburkholderia atlantica]MBB5507664.1 drug/metabolite transporter (DMT)-like permease [Paraburkholderia atlantica]
MRADGKASSAAAITGVLVGVAMVSTRAVSSHASPPTLAFLRYLIGTLVLAVPVLCGPRPRFTLKDALAIAVLGVFQFALLIVLINEALRTLSAAICALVFSTMPLFTMIFAIMVGREVFRWTKLAGLTLAVCGIALLLAASASPGGARPSTAPAFAALFGATLIGAVCSIMYRPYVQRYPALPTSALAMTAAVVFLAVWCVVASQPLVPGLTVSQWANVGVIGLSSGIGYFCLLWALARIDASRVVAFQALGPVTAAAIELFIARRPPSMTLLVSIAIVVMGLELALSEAPHWPRRSGTGRAARR